MSYRDRLRIFGHRLARSVAGSQGGGISGLPSKALPPPDTSRAGYVPGANPLPLLALALLIAACAPAAPQMPPAPSQAPATASPSLPAKPDGGCQPQVIFPTDTTQLKMGQSTRFIARVLDPRGEPCARADVTFELSDPDDRHVISLQAYPRGADLYQTDPWELPHRATEGMWSLTALVDLGGARSSSKSEFELVNGTSEVLLAKYGFWLDPPELRGIALQHSEEKGDAGNGAVLWRGSLLGLHITPAIRVELHWREGDHGLKTPDDVRRFVLAEGLGAMSELREVVSAEPYLFKGWKGWLVQCLTHSWEEMQWVVFYAPEVDRTFALATILTLPPSISDPHAELRDSFAVFPDVQATGVAPLPLPRLLPGPELVSPALAARYEGLDDPIVLQWAPVKDLAEDEFYQIDISYSYKESNPTATFTTREASLTLPEDLYLSPNCSVFNWQVTLRREAGLGLDGRPHSEPISYPSFYWYVWWLHPEGEDPAFPPGCPYTHVD